MSLLATSCRPFSTFLAAALAFAGLLFGSPAPALATPSPAELLEGIRSSELEPAKAVELSGVRLAMGAATFDVAHGVMVPASSVGEHAVEMVFLGRARVLMEPPDAIEGGQLELFTGDSRLAETVTEGVLVVTLDAASKALLDRPALEELDAERAAKAEELFATWRSSPERKLLGVEGALLGDAVGDPFTEGYFAGWLDGGEVGRFLFLDDPGQDEQVTVGQFVELEASEKEKRKLRRVLHKQKKKGRLMGVEVEDLGTWDTWVSTTHRREDGAPRPGLQAFEPQHYTLDATLDPRDQSLQGKARLRLMAVSDVGRIAVLTLDSNLVVDEIKDAAGEPLFFYHQGSEVRVVLPEAPARESLTEIEVTYHGNVLQKFEGKTYFLDNTMYWYPHCGSTDLATYDLTLRWPKRYDVVASGEKVEGGEEGDFAWARHRLDVPTVAASFELGRFRTLTRQAGHVEISLSLDTEAKGLLRDNQEELLDTLAEALLFFEETYGPYPLDRLTAVTTPRTYSQSLLGFITLSTIMMLDEDGLMALLFGFEDPRTVIAHEVAHQWWGHVVGIKSYREEWISESMANYSAVVFNRKKLAPERPSAIGPTTGWQIEMSQQTEDGRAYESLGPLALGSRLNSSIAYAHGSIVYKKGAVVMDMLSRFFGEENFLKVLKAAAGYVNHRSISTEDFLTLVSKLSGADLEGFADQFIYGTGLPEVYYTYDIEPQGEGWVIRVKTRQQSPHDFNYRAVAKGGRLDVERQGEERVDVSASRIAVPIQIFAFDPAREKEELKKRKKDRGPLKPGYVAFLTHRTLVGEEAELELPLQIEPKGVTLDPDQEVFGTFYDERRHPKRMLFYRGYDRLVRNDLDGAEAALQEALGADVYFTLADEPAKDEKDQRQEGEILDLRIRLRLAEIHLDRQDLDAAGQEITLAEDLVNRRTPDWLRDRVKTTRARQALLSGDAEEAYKILRKVTKSRGRLVSGQHNSLLFAIAAHQTGREEDFQEALERAETKGADVGVLREL